MTKQGHVYAVNPSERQAVKRSILSCVANLTLRSWVSCMRGPSQEQHHVPVAISSCKLVNDVWLVPLGQLARFVSVDQDAFAAVHVECPHSVSHAIWCYDTFFVGTTVH